MKRSDVLKQKRASKVEAQGRMIDKRTAEKREAFTEEETTQFQSLQEEVRGLDAEIAQAIAEEEVLVNRAAANAVPLQNEPQKRTAKTISLVSMIRSRMNGQTMTAEETELRELGVAERRANGKSVEDTAIVIPSSAMRAAQTVDGNSGADGGELVETSVRLVEGLYPTFKIEEMGATVLSGLQGDVKLPVFSNYSFSFVAEDTDVSATKTTVSGPTLAPKRVAGVVDISKKLIQQSSPDVEAVVVAKIRQAIEAAFTSAAINGAGGDAPEGILANSSVPTGSATGVPTYAAVVELETKIETENATATSLNYLMRPELKGLLKTTEKSSGTGKYIFENNELNGYQAVSSTLVPKLDSNSKYPLIFGDWSQLFIGIWGGIAITVDPYTQASKGNVRLVIEMYGDVAIANPKAFAVNKVFTLTA